MYRLLLTWVGKLILVATRLRGHGGSALPGLVVEKLSPRFLAKTVKQLKDGCVLITGTNGKTTTTKILRDILASGGERVITNTAGSNMSRGIISALVEQSNWLGQLPADTAVFEVDEAFAADVAAKTKPKAIVVLNLLRDQLDRYGELDTTAKLIGAGLKHARQVVLNADDKLVKGLAKGLDRKQVIYFGASPSLRKQLPDDESLLNKARTKTGGRFEAVDVLLNSAKAAGGRQDIKLHYQRRDYAVSLGLLGVYNAYNAAAALAAGTVFKLPFEQSVGALASVSPPFGRSERISIGDKTLELLLVKNPAGFNQIINTFLLRQSHLPVLMALNDNFADGRDVSWIWDVDFEPLAKREHKILVSGLRGYDLALRLRYAEVKSRVNRNFAQALKTFIDGLGKDEVGYVVPTYTALLALRKLIAKQTEVKEMWK